MSNHLSPYLVFSGQTREALTFYQQVFGGETSFMTFGDVGDPGDFPADAIMHGQLTTDDGWTIMAGDSTKPGDEVVRGGSTLCVWGDGFETLTQQFERLSEGATVNVPLEKQVWGDVYGELTDKLGISWAFNLAHADSSE